VKTGRAQVLPLIASLAAGFKGDPVALERIRELCRARRRDVASDFFLTAAMSVVQVSACSPECTTNCDCEFSHICRQMASHAAENLAEMARISRELTLLDNDAEGAPMLLGEAAVLLGLYRSLGAFRARLWVVGVPGHDQGSQRSATVDAVVGNSGQVRIGHLGGLQGLVEQVTVEVDLVGRRWRVPRRELLTVLLAARVGDPDSTPLPPMWVHLAVALEAWRDNVRYDQVSEIAERLGLAPQVHRGLAVTLAIMPHLRAWLPMRRLKIPLWERTITLPLAAKRLLDDALEASPAFGPEGEDQP